MITNKLLSSTTLTNFDDNTSKTKLTFEIEITTSINELIKHVSLTKDITDYLIECTHSFTENEIETPKTKKSVKKKTSDKKETDNIEIKEIKKNITRNDCVSIMQKYINISDVDKMNRTESIKTIINEFGKQKFVELEDNQLEEFYNRINTLCLTK